MTRSEQLEREAEQTRIRLEDTLEELRGRMTPGHVLDEVIDYARDGKAGTFFRNLGQQTVENPLPIATVGVGLAWLMLASRNGAGHRNGASDGTAGESAGRALAAAGDSVSDAARQAASGTRSTVGSLAGAARRARSRVAETAGEMQDATVAAGDAAAGRAAEAYDAAASRVRRATSAIGDSASGAGRQVAETTRGLVAFCREQPLVLAGIGLAIGALLGAALPASEAENRLMGPASDEARRRIGQVASQVTEAGAEAAAGVSGVGAGDEPDAAGLSGPGDLGPVQPSGETEPLTSGRGDGRAE
jgi:ElaB/YqjD/DUF883 family membrane-anchored ribosome-binding protein